MSRTPLAQRLHTVAAQLAGQIEGGAFDALAPAGVAELTDLGHTIAGLADLVETTEHQRDDAVAIVAQQTAARRSLRHALRTLGLA